MINRIDSFETVQNVDFVFFKYFYEKLTDYNLVSYKY